MTPPRCLLPCLLATLAIAARAAGAENPYPPTPDSQVQPGIPQGRVTKYSFESPAIFPGTQRDYWVYVPSQLDRARPAPVMIFQDGIGYKAPTVFDNLIHRGELPPLVGVFVTPGRVRAASTNALDRFNRSVEYDGLGDEYARFLLEELLPDVSRRTGLTLSTNGNDRAIAGASSGAIAAFTAAWERPDAFRRVFSSIGTYVGLRGGNAYPVLIRKTEPKPVRIFLQDGDRDQNIYGGDWWIANQDMLSALDFAGYDVRHAWGKGGHDGNQATQVFPDAVRWLWRDWPAPVTANPAGRSRQPVATDLIVAGQDWQLVSSGHGSTTGAAASGKGEVYFADTPVNRIHRIGPDGRVTIFAEDTGGASGLKFDARGELNACAGNRKSLSIHDAAGRARTLVENVEAADLVILANGDRYVTDPAHHQVWHVNPAGRARVVDAGIASPGGITASPDQSLLYVADSRGHFVYSWQIQPDGSLAHRQRYFHLHVPDTADDSGAAGMAVDTQGRLYVATRLGVQVCDQAGRVNSILSKPGPGPLSSVCFGGAGFDELHVTSGGQVFKRKLRSRGLLSVHPPVKPPAPRL